MTHYIFHWILLFLVASKVSGEQSECGENDANCNPYASKEYDAIQWLHAHLDDDKDGEIDPMESAEFLVSELEKNSGEVSSRQTSFHRNDSHISMDELWQIWIHSTPHNWTTDDVIRWLELVVGLPEYSEIFREQEIKGSTLPLIAANLNYFVSSILHVRNPIHRRKLIIKAQDVILFGPPIISLWMSKLLLQLLAALLVVGVTFFIYYQRHSREEILKLKLELDHLKKAESALEEMQQKLTVLQHEHTGHQASRQTSTKNKDDEDGPSFQLGAPVEYRRLSSVDVEEARREAERIGEERRATEEKLRRLELAEEELERLRELLAKLERDMEVVSNIKNPGLLEQLLVVTYQTESRWLETRLTDAQRRMNSAREACLKVGKKHANLFGILRVSHNTLTEVDRSVLEAGHALNEVRADVEERMERWNQIEALTGFHIISQQALEEMARLLVTPTAALAGRQLHRISSTLLKTRNSAIFDSISTSLNYADNSMDEDNSSLASLKLGNASAPGDQTSSNSLYNTIITANQHLQQKPSSIMGRLPSRSLLTREARRNSWLESDHSSTSTDPSSTQPHASSHDAVNSPPPSTSSNYSASSTAILAYSSPPLPHITETSNTPRHRQAP